LTAPRRFFDAIRFSRAAAFGFVARLFLGAACRMLEKRGEPRPAPPRDSAPACDAPCFDEQDIVLQSCGCPQGSADAPSLRPAATIRRR
jgi:hypothetical protein